MGNEFFDKCSYLKLLMLSLHVNLQKSCNIVFRPSKEKVSSSLTMNNQSPRQVKETNSFGVVLTGDVSCANDVERAKAAFFEQIGSIYDKLFFFEKNVLLHFFRLHTMSFYVAETLYMKLKKIPDKHFSTLLKSCKTYVEEICTTVNMSASGNKLTYFKAFPCL